MERRSLSWVQGGRFSGHLALEVVIWSDSPLLLTFLLNNSTKTCQEEKRPWRFLTCKSRNVSLTL